jgi:hypothetical protein
VGSKGYLKIKDRLRGIWRLGSQDEEKNQAKKASSQDWTYVAQISHTKVNNAMVARVQFKHHVASLLCLGCIHVLHFLVLVTYGRLLVSSTLTQQTTWFDKCVGNYTLFIFMVHGLHEVCVSFTYHGHKL